MRKVAEDVLDQAKKDHDIVEFCISDQGFGLIVYCLVFILSVQLCSPLG